MADITYHAIRGTRDGRIEEIRCTRPPASEGGSCKNERVEHVRYWPGTKKGEKDAIASIWAFNGSASHPNHPSNR